MITRSKLVEQLRDYQIRSQHKCPALTVFSPTPSLSTWPYDFLKTVGKLQGFRLLGFIIGFWFDVAVAIFWAFLFTVLLVSSYVTLYLKHYWISFGIMFLAILIPYILRISRQSIARKRDRRLLLPLSM